MLRFLGGGDWTASVPQALVCFLSLATLWSLRGGQKPAPGSAPPPLPSSFQLAKLIQIQPCLMTLISAKEEPKPRAPKEEKRPPWAPPPQHNFLKNWKRHIALRKKQQEALSGEPSWRRDLPGSLHQGTKVFCIFSLSRLALAHESF